MRPLDSSPLKSRIFINNGTLRNHYHSLRTDDIFIGRLRLKQSEEHLLLDLVERGVILYPSALSQQVCRSKTFQALLYGSQMLPHTRIVHDQHDMLDTVNYYQQNKVEKVITKEDRKNAGMGIHLWQGVEDVFTHSSLGTLPFPFVVQPFAGQSTDIRVIILDNYMEAYSRKNPHNFRNNLHCGGKSSQCTLTEKQRDLCTQAMARGKFPYAHIDLMILENGETYLAEINLRGGIKGARISPEEYRTRIKEIHQKFVDSR